MKTIVFFFFSAPLTGVSFTQDSADNSPEKAAVMANDRAYEAAYSKADVKALADFFTEDAQYTTDDGRTLDGRAAIEGSIKTAFQTGKRAKRQSSSIRFVSSPEVVLRKAPPR
jgi:uncharacterized protein (TIGR02246 family)